jgi:hypothetical protein
MRSALIFFETTSELETWLCSKLFAQDKAIYVALTPEAVHAAEKAGINYCIIEDYCDLDEIEETCVAQFIKINEICLELDNLILSKDEFLKKWHIKPFWLSLEQIGGIVDILLSRSVMINNILKKHPDADIYVHLAPTQFDSSRNLMFSKHETLWGRLLNLSGWENHITIVPINEVSKIKVSGFLVAGRKYFRMYEKRFKSVIYKTQLFNDIFSSFWYDMTKNGFNHLLRFFRKTKEEILLLNSNGDWIQYVKSPVCHKRTIGFIRNELFRDKLEKEVFPTWKNETKTLFGIFCDSIETTPIDFTSLLKDQICWLIEKNSMIARQVVKKLESINSKRNIKAILSGSTTNFIEACIKQYFYQVNIPVINYQHGAVWYDKRITQRRDLMDMRSTSHLLVYGEGCRKAFESSILSRQCKIKSIGSIKLDDISAKKIKSNRDRKRVLYVITNYYENAWYCGFTPPFNDIKYYIEQCNIVFGLIKIIENTNKAEMTIQLHPGANLHGKDPPWVDELENKKNIHLNREGNFVKMLDKHDVVIVDCLTTTLLEAISTKLPVFALTSIISPPLHELTILEERAVCVANGVKLIEEVSKYLTSGYYPADIEDRGYLKLYGTHLDDAGSADRIINDVEKIIS